MKEARHTGSYITHSSCCEDTLVHKKPWEKCLTSSSLSVLRLCPWYITGALPASPGISGRLAVLFPGDPGLIASPSTVGGYFLEAQGPWESSPEHQHWPVSMVVSTKALEGAGHSFRSLARLLIPMLIANRPGGHCGPLLSRGGGGKCKYVR